MLIWPLLGAFLRRNIAGKKCVIIVSLINDCNLILQRGG
jgi:hypothetical protein